MPRRRTNGVSVITMGSVRPLDAAFLSKKQYASSCCNEIARAPAPLVVAHPPLVIAAGAALATSALVAGVQAGDPLIDDAPKVPITDTAKAAAVANAVVGEVPSQGDGADDGLNLRTEEVRMRGFVKKITKWEVGLTPSKDETDSSAKLKEGNVSWASIVII